MGLAGLLNPAYLLGRFLSDEAERRSGGGGGGWARRGSTGDAGMRSTAPSVYVSRSGDKPLRPNGSCSDLARFRKGLKGGS